jgi:hypothetical protein
MVLGRLAIWLNNFAFFFFSVSCGGVRLSLSLQPLIGLLHKPRMIDECGAFGESELAGETEVLGGNLPQCHIVHQKSHMT